MKKYLAAILSISFFFGASIAYAQMEMVAPADTSGPVISDVQSMSVGVNDQTIMWSTDELATSAIRYGTTEGLGQTAVAPGSAALTHSATLTGLAPGTTYHFCIDATDTSGNTSTSCGHTFTTAEEPAPVDTEPPVVTNISVSSITRESATIGWSTDEVATGYVEYGTTPDYGSLTPLPQDFATEHEVSLSGLSADTAYYYRVVVSDAAGNSSMTPGESFATEAAPAPESGEPEPETTAPATTTPASEPTATSTPATEAAVIFSAVTTEQISTSTVTILWETNVPTDSLIEYGDTAALGSESAHDTSLTTVHEVPLSGLASATAYYFRITARPSGAANTVSSGLHSFSTLAEPEFVDRAADITDVAASSITETGAQISWLTDELTAGSLEYGTTAAYGSTALAASSSQEQAVILSALAPGTTYHYRAKAVDSGSNVTYSLDHTFTTIATSSTSPQEAAASTAPANAPLPLTLPPAYSASGGGSKLPLPAPPLLIAATGADSEIAFEWNNPEALGFAGVVLVRGAGAYPSSPADGAVLYRGDAETFTDTNLTNGTDYHYALYAYNGNGRLSNPVIITLAPVARVEEVRLEKNAVLVPDVAQEHFADTLAQGAQGIEVIHLQQLLNVAGVHESGLTTGYFGPLTEGSLKQFQDLHNLSQTGITDDATRAKLNAISASHRTTGAPASIALVEQDLSLGASGREVTYLQQFLAYEGSYPEALVTGYYGPLTQAALARLQAAYGITPALGYMGPKTRHTIQTMLGF